MTLTAGMFSVVGDVLHVVGDNIAAQQATGFDPYRTQALPTDAQGVVSQQTVTGAAQTSADLTSQQRVTEVAAGEEVRIPVIREEAVVRTREIERGGVRVHKTVNEREEVVEQPTYQEQVQVERIPIGQVIAAMPEVREEGDTLIIPVVEEMLVVEKRLVLKEEVRITRQRTQTTEQARVVLREEQVSIEQLGQRPDDQLNQRTAE
jgi:uncharacterized protein (TIGR02271 family)